jgi:hypothetical protein
MKSVPVGNIMLIGDAEQQLLQITGGFLDVQQFVDRCLNTQTLYPGGRLKVLTENEYYECQVRLSQLAGLQQTIAALQTIQQEYDRLLASLGATRTTAGERVAELAGCYGLLHNHCAPATTVRDFDADLKAKKKALQEANVKVAKLEEKMESMFKLKSPAEGKPRSLGDCSTAQEKYYLVNILVENCQRMLTSLNSNDTPLAICLAHAEHKHAESIVNLKAMEPKSKIVSTFENDGWDRHESCTKCFNSRHGVLFKLKSGCSFQGLQDAAKISNHSHLFDNKDKMWKTWRAVCLYVVS